MKARYRVLVSHETFSSGALWDEIKSSSILLQINQAMHALEKGQADDFCRLWCPNKEDINNSLSFLVCIVYYFIDQGWGLLRKIHVKFHVS